MSIRDRSMMLFNRKDGDIITIKINACIVTLSTKVFESVKIFDSWTARSRGPSQ